MPTTWLVRTAGSNTNGGTSAAVRSTGTDGVTGTAGGAPATNTLTSASANWSSADVGHGIYIGGVNQRRVVTVVSDAHTLTFDGATIAGATGRTWTLGGSMLTFAQALGAQGIRSGDTLYVGAGVYREVVTPTLSAAAETFILGDIDGAHTGDPGEVRLTAYLTNDKTAPGATSCLVLNVPYLTFQDLTIVGGTASAVTLAATATHCTLRRCVLLAVNGAGRCVNATINYNAPLTLTVDACKCATNFSQTVLASAATGVGADYDVGVVVTNSLLINTSGEAVRLSPTGTSAGHPGGVIVRNCTLWAATAFNATTVYLSTSIPCVISNCLAFGTLATGLAGPPYAATEDYNILSSPTVRTNLGVGTHTIADTSYCGLLEFGRSFMLSSAPRPYWGLAPDSPALGYGNDGTQPATDVLARPRPAGALLPAVGAFECHNTAVQEAGANADGGSGSALKLVGPADHDVVIPVNASATTLTVRVAWDANHADTNKPQAILLANGQIGVSAQTVTAAGSAGGGYETLTFGPFTPSAAGWVTLRLISRSAAANGIAWFDTATGGATGSQSFDYWNRGEPFPAAVAAGGNTLIVVDD